MTPRVRNVLIGLALVAACFAIYLASQPDRSNPYLHFVWQAQAWVDGDATIPLVAPSDGIPGNDYQDIMPILDADGAETGRGLMPFPPLPAVLLLPFVALWHLRTDEQLVAMALAAVNVGLGWWVLGMLRVRPAVRLLTAVFLGLGTGLWYAAAIGTTWFWAHIVAMTCTLGAIGLALRADRGLPDRPVPLARATAAVRPRAWPGGGRAAAAFALTAALTAVLLALGAAGASTTAVATTAAALGVAAMWLAVRASGRRAVLASLVVPATAALPVVLLAGSGVQSAARLRYVLLALAACCAVAAVAGFPAGLAATRDRVAGAFRSPATLQVMAGMLLGLAVTARLTVIFAMPFFLLVGGGRGWLRKGLLAGAGAAIPVAALLVATYAASGHLFNPAYDFQYQREAAGYWWLNYHPDWNISDLRYVPQNLGIMLGQLPLWMPEADTYGNALCQTATTRGWFDPACPRLLPDPVGTSLLLASPALLLAPFAWLPVLRRRNRHIDRLTIGATLAVLAIAFVNLMHFSQGWVQFGYRFGNDFLPFALLLVAVGADRLRRVWPLALLVALSVLVTWWGVRMGVRLGW